MYYVLPTIKNWINDDDPGVVAPGWFRLCNLGTGDFNNDLPLAILQVMFGVVRFTGNNIAVIAPKEAGAGKIEIQIDGQSRTTVDLSNTGERMPQQIVYEATGLASGKHIIKIINSGSGKVAVDALIIGEKQIHMKKFLLFGIIVLLSFVYFSCKYTKSPEPYGPVPSENQMRWQEMEYYAFVHFSLNTYTNQSWGFRE